MEDRTKLSQSQNNEGENHIKGWGSDYFQLNIDSFSVKKMNNVLQWLSFFKSWVSAHHMA